MAEPRDFIALRIAILTVSDTRMFANDTSGQTLHDRITGAGHKIGRAHV